ncbi:uncharacterized protein CGFF_04355 [Nakaseomyces glabratus]|nr:hypothetical protein J6894_01791 [Nakaseomyces glabratus]QNG13873.1 uncharacterized protein GWK60_G03817 [Nakaseomyces glabratus]SCV16794.1 uncharacterized protein CGFF_04355 [Nakaseomyces glabratus]SLM16593.1 uncharacterized protein CGFF_04355 [Nakaseomyces glabratus]
MPLLVYKILFSTELCYAPRCDWEYLSQPCHTRKPTFSVLWDSRAILGEETKRVAVTGSASIFSIIFQLIVRGDFGLLMMLWSLYTYIVIWCVTCIGICVHITYNLQII